MNEKIPVILGVVSLVVAAIVLIVSVSGAFWPATPITDIGMLSTVGIFALLGAMSLMVPRVQN